jgi:hypothetical protein
VRFSYFLLADTSSTGESGKTNLLGVGARVFNRNEPNEIVPIVVAGSVEGMPSEAGEYPLRMTLRFPNGEKETLVDTKGELPDASKYPELPVNFSFTLTMIRQYTNEGVHKIQATFGELEAEYDFLVATIPKAKTASRKTPRPRKPKRSTPKPRA